MTAPIFPITLAQIRAHSPCADGWAKLLRGLGLPATGYDPETRVTLGDVAAICGARDAMWCVRALPWPDARADVARALAPCVERARAAAYYAAYAAAADADAAYAAAADADAAYAAAAYAAAAAAYYAAADAHAARDARDAEREQQAADIIAVFGRLHAPQERPAMDAGEPSKVGAST